jgi:hypothetical protein
MKTTIAIASLLWIAAAATGAAALPDPYFGGDTALVSAIVQAVAPPLNGEAPQFYYSLGGGSAAGQTAMGARTAFSAAFQQTAQMTHMMNGGVCTANGGALGEFATGASGVVVGLDAVDVFSSTLSGAQATAACNGAADETGSGLAYSGTTGVFAGSNAGQTWKWVLALVYGGVDRSAGGVNATADCGSTARKNLVANWSRLFQGGACTSSVLACNSAPQSGQLWHAFVPQQGSETAEVFSNILGLSPQPSYTSSNGFGASPYCNALNWDTSTANANCAHGANDQFTGPGGVVDPASKCVVGGSCGAAGSGNHRRPPPGTWGDAPDPSQGALGADVLPVAFQDNDPIRRPCIGGASATTRPGEEVCNLDGALGLVLPVVDSSWIPQTSPQLAQYPTNICNSFAFGKAARVFTCAIRGQGTLHSGECPNGDALFAGGCLLPIDATSSTPSQCRSFKAVVAALQVRNLGNPDGRVYNVHMRDGTGVEPTIGYLQYVVPATPPASTSDGTYLIGSTLDFAGGYYRIHAVETVLGHVTTPGPIACQMQNAEDQIGCLLQADPCSIGIARRTAATFASRPNGATGSGGTPGGIDALRVAQVYPTTTSVQSGATPTSPAGPQYPVWRKLYFNSLVGFANVASTSADPTASDELLLAKFEASPAQINPILTSLGYFTLGAGSPAGGDVPYCEDFDEQLWCNVSGPPNVNACPTNPTGLPSVANTSCGNGILEFGEECDLGLGNAPTATCTMQCRSTL